MNLGPVFNVRYSSSRDLNAAQMRTGYVIASASSHLGTAGLERSTLGKRFVVPAGYRRVDVVAEMDDVRWQIFGNALGHVLGEVRVDMVLNDGTQVLCRDERTLGLFQASGVVGTSEFRRPGRLRFACSYARPAGAQEKTYTASLSVYATASGIGFYADMFTFVEGRISSMRATVSP
jgi:hypothetical protein